MNSTIVIEVTDIYKSKFDKFDENHLESILEEYYRNHGIPRSDIINLIWSDCCEVLKNELNIGIT